MYITKNDFKTQIRVDILDKILDNDTDILNESILAATEEMQSYLKSRYAVATIFAATGTERNALLMMYMIDITLYHIHSRVNPRQVPEIRFVRYEAAITWLKSVSAGKIVANLELLPDTDGTGTNNNAGSIEMVTFPKRYNNY